MKYKTSIAIYLLTSLFIRVFAQSDVYIPNEKPLDYKRIICAGGSIATPIAKMSDYYKSWSYSGAFAEYRSYVNNKLTVGISMGWISFYGQRERETYELKNGSITTEGIRLYNNLHARLNCFYSLLYTPMYSLSIGGALGLHYNSEELHLGYLNKTAHKWSPGIAPSLNYLQSFCSSGRCGLFTSIGYTAIPLRSEAYFAAQYISFRLGTLFRL